MTFHVVPFFSIYCDVGFTYILNNHSNYISDYMKTSIKTLIEFKDKNKFDKFCNVIEEEFTQASNWHLGSGLSIVLMIFILVNMILSAVFDKDGEGNFL